jgi:hypothetical protein
MPDEHFENASPTLGPERDLRWLRREGVSTPVINIYIQNVTINQNPSPGERMVQWERIAIFAFGVLFTAALVILAIFFPIPTQFQYLVFRIVLALACAGVAALIPGMINVDIPYVRAGGALAVFVFVFRFSPAALVVSP